MSNKIFVNKRNNFAVEFFFRADKALDSSLERKRKLRIFFRHKFVEFPKLLRLRSKKVIVLQKFRKLNQKIAVNHINRIFAFHR